MICTQCEKWIKEGETIVVICGRPYHPMCSYKAAKLSTNEVQSTAKGAAKWLPWRSAMRS